MNGHKEFGTRARASYLVEYRLLQIGFNVMISTRLVTQMDLKFVRFFTYPRGNPMARNRHGPEIPSGFSINQLKQQPTIDDMDLKNEIPQ